LIEKGKLLESNWKRKIHMQLINYCTVDTFEAQGDKRKKLRCTGQPPVRKSTGALAFGTWYTKTHIIVYHFTREDGHDNRY
jgi:hypothetical protein